MEPAVKPEEIPRLVVAEPFQPFRIHLTDGSEHLIEDRGMVYIAKHEIVVGHRREDEVIPSRTSYFRPLHITRLETFADSE